MKCARCNRPIYSGKGLRIGALIVGPTCAQKMAPQPPKRRYLRLFNGGPRQLVDERQPDLFGVAA